jgi:hypothetical protein
LANIKDVNSIIISPNPATDFIQITAANNSTDFEIELIDFVGKTICKVYNQNKLAITQFRKGIYLVKVTDKQKNVFMDKIIIE